ncbi:MAG: TetR/AcrR family transcriptional regulator [Actinomycetia bacterium]|nr:TetR/AcrR family transcriptional regulator [Actinomycetes bacterium]
MDTHAKVVRAALDLFAERGYAATTTKEIARVAGVNEVTVFRRFGSKAGVLDAIGDWLRELPVPPLDDVEDVRGTLLRWARSDAEQAARHGGLMLRMAFDARSVPEVAQALSSDRGPAGGLAALTDYFARAAQAGVVRTDVPAAVLAEGFMAMTSSTVMYRCLMGLRDGDPAEAVEPLVAVFCDGALTARSTTDH